MGLCRHLLAMAFYFLTIKVGDVRFCTYFWVSHISFIFVRFLLNLVESCNRGVDQLIELVYSFSQKKEEVNLVRWFFQLKLLLIKPKRRKELTKNWLFSSHTEVQGFFFWGGSNLHSCMPYIWILATLIFTLKKTLKKFTVLLWVTISTQYKEVKHWIFCQELL